ncbi:MAG: hypothetical protein BWZ03_00008 [bacterium ADurb.BinA186]|nr:MAG: hypothetical protein BWZ03_00008 [bacterium ADurb.BinA186]
MRNQVQPLNKEDILASIKEQIQSFDNKAEILLAVIGILFGLSITALTSLDKIDTDDQNSPWFIVFLLAAGLFAISSIVAVVLALLVIYPRKKKSPDFDVCYYWDISNNHGLFLEKIDNSEETEPSLKRQICSNADVCTEKHRYLVVTIWSLIPFSVFLILELVCFVFLILM